MSYNYPIDSKIVLSSNRWLIELAEDHLLFRDKAAPERVIQDFPLIRLSEAYLEYRDLNAFWIYQDKIYRCLIQRQTLSRKDRDRLCAEIYNNGNNGNFTEPSFIVKVFGNEYLALASCLFCLREPGLNLSTAAQLSNIQPHLLSGTLSTSNRQEKVYGNSGNAPFKGHIISHDAEIAQRLQEAYICSLTGADKSSHHLTTPTPRDDFADLKTDKITEEDFSFFDKGMVKHNESNSGSGGSTRAVSPLSMTNNVDKQEPPKLSIITRSNSIDRYAKGGKFDYKPKTSPNDDIKSTGSVFTPVLEYYNLATTAPSQEARTQTSSSKLDCNFSEASRFKLAHDQLSHKHIDTDTFEPLHINDVAQTDALFNFYLVFRFADFIFNSFALTTPGPSGFNLSRPEPADSLALNINLLPPKVSIRPNYRSMNLEYSCCSTSLANISIHSQLAPLAGQKNLAALMILTESDSVDTTRVWQSGMSNNYKVILLMDPSSLMFQKRFQMGTLTWLPIAGSLTPGILKLDQYLITEPKKEKRLISMLKTASSDIISSVVRTQCSQVVLFLRDCRTVSESIIDILKWVEIFQAQLESFSEGNENKWKSSVHLRILRSLDSPLDQAFGLYNSLPLIANHCHLQFAQFFQLAETNRVPDFSVSADRTLYDKIRVLPDRSIHFTLRKSSLYGSLIVVVCDDKCEFMECERVESKKSDWLHDLIVKLSERLHFMFRLVINISAEISDVDASEYENIFQSCLRDIPHLRSCCLVEVTLNKFFVTCDIFTKHFSTSVRSSIKIYQTGSQLKAFYHINGVGMMVEYRLILSQVRSTRKNDNTMGNFKEICTQFHNMCFYTGTIRNRRFLLPFPIMFSIVGGNF